MNELSLQEAKEVIYKDKKYSVVSPLSLDLVLLKDISSGEMTTANASELTPSTNGSTPNDRENVTDLTLIAEKDWQETERRKVVLDELINKPEYTLEMAELAGKKLNFSWR